MKEVKNTSFRDVNFIGFLFWVFGVFRIVCRVKILGFLGFGIIFSMTEDLIGMCLYE